MTIEIPPTLENDLKIVRELKGTHWADESPVFHPALDRVIAAAQASLATSKPSTGQTEARVQQEVAGDIRKSLDGMMHGIHTLYDIARVIPHPYDALGDYASNILHDFAATSHRIIRFLDRVEGKR